MDAQIDVENAERRWQGHDLGTSDLYGLQRKYQEMLKEEMVNLEKWYRAYKHKELEKENGINSGNAIYDDYIATELSRIINKYGPVKTTELLESII